MKILGLQKLTLLDYPKKIACTVFAAGCNLRCPFCHNASLVLTKHSPRAKSAEPFAEIPEAEVLRFLAKRKGILEGVCVSGGEPLLQDDVTDFLRSVKEMGFSVKLDTNGSFPGKLKEIVSAGLVDYVAMDVKNSPELYGKTCGKEDFDVDSVKESVEFLKSGTVDYEFRTTLVKGLHDAESMEKIGQWIEGAKRYYLQEFIDSGDLLAPNLSGLDKDEMKHLEAIAKKYVPKTKLRGVS